jgi:hypothetical protein
MPEIDAHIDERNHSVALTALLIEDVIAARQRLNVAGTQTARRDVVRASLAAIEGMTWVARDHVRTALAQLDHLSPIADLALRERSFAVAENGQLTERAGILPVLTAIRLVVTQAKIISPEIAVEFAGAGWSDLRRSVAVRNRITHPKLGEDLAISDRDLAAVGSGLSWLVATLDYVMTSTNLALTSYNDHLRELVQRLTAGDPDALAEYHSALQASRDD